MQGRDNGCKYPTHLSITVVFTLKRVHRVHVEQHVQQLKATFTVFPKFSAYGVLLQLQVLKCSHKSLCVHLWNDLFGSAFAAAAKPEWKALQRKKKPRLTHGNTADHSSVSDIAFPPPTTLSHSRPLFENNMYLNAISLLKLCHATTTI